MKKFAETHALSLSNFRSVRLVAEVLATSTLASTSPMAKRWPSSWSRSRLDILSFSTNQNCTKFCKAASAFHTSDGKFNCL